MPTYESHVTTSPVFAGPAWITYPFAQDGDTTTKIVHQPLLQLADRYAPPTLGGVFSGALANFSGSPVTVGDAYCIGDTEPNLTDAGLVSFTRMWANIPATRLIPSGSTLYQFVGLPVGAAAGAAKTLTAATFTSSSSVFTSTAHGYSASDNVRVDFKVSIGGATYQNSFFGLITSVTTDTFTVPFQFVGFVPTFVSGKSIEMEAYRETFQGKVSTLTRFEYALPGVTSGITTSLDFTPTPSFRPVVSATGQAVADYEDLQNKLSASTTPTATEYRTMIAGGDLLSTESEVSPWKGTILERRTILVRAI